MTTRTMKKSTRKTSIGGRGRGGTLLTPADRRAIEDAQGDVNRIYYGGRTYCSIAVAIFTTTSQGKIDECERQVFKTVVVSPEKRCVERVCDRVQALARTFDRHASLSRDRIGLSSDDDALDAGGGGEAE